MGKIEKLVVLGVLVLIVVILAVTFSPPEVEGRTPRDMEVARGNGRRIELGDETGTNSSHIDRDRVGPEDMLVQPSEVPANSGASAQPDKGERSKAPLLNTGVVLKDRLPKAAPPEGSILLTLDGLEDSAVDDFKIYRAKSGESYAGLAERFYGDADRAALLKLYNEGQPTVVAGRPMFVPVFDVELPAEDSTVAVGGDYVVQEGESLWEIAADQLGAGSKWPQLHEANLDVLPDPHDLKPGMTLKIPR